MSDNAATTHTYEVLTPEYGEVVPILDDGTGPMEWGRDWMLVHAASKREAVSIAVKRWLAGWPERAERWAVAKYCQEQRRNGECPYTGVRAAIFQCEHGIEWPVEDEPEGPWCPDCERKWTEMEAEDSP